MYTVRFLKRTSCSGSYHKTPSSKNISEGLPFHSSLPLHPKHIIADLKHPRHDTDQSKLFYDERWRVCGQRARTQSFPQFLLPRNLRSHPTKTWECHGIQFVSLQGTQPNSRKCLMARSRCLFWILSGQVLLRLFSGAGILTWLN